MQDSINCEIIQIRGVQCSWISKLLLVRRDIISWVRKIITREVYLVYLHSMERVYILFGKLILFGYKIELSFLLTLRCVQ